MWAKIRQYAPAVKEFPSSLLSGNLEEISVEPLLLYLLARGTRREVFKLTEETNINTIYQELILEVYERGYAKDPADGRLKSLKGIDTEEKFVQLLSDIALAGWWRGDSRTATYEEVIEAAKTSGRQDQHRELHDDGSKISRLLFGFYFQKAEEPATSKAFQFTHKTFGEYLIAKRLIEEARRIAKIREVDPRTTNERHLLDWFYLAGKTLREDSLFQFLERETEISIGEREAGGLYRHVEELLRDAIVDGMPFDQKENETFREAKEKSAMALDCLWALAKRLARRAGKRLNLKFEDRSAAHKALLEIRSVRTHDTLLGELFVRADMSRTNLSYAPLQELDFGHANLSNSNLSGADLRETNLVGASLQGANLNFVTLQSASLRVANLQLADLLFADLSHAELQEAKLMHANLNNANLQDTELQEANLSSADLQHADLRDSNLSMADLQRANLMYANLQYANLLYANLRGANLMNAGLEQVLLGGISWDEETDWGMPPNELPEEIKKQLRDTSSGPKHHLD